MSTISAGTPAVAESIAAHYNTSKTGKRTDEKTEDLAVTKNEGSKDTVKKTKVNGRTIGSPELTEKAAKYYEELKKKYGNLDFILVSKDQKEYAKANASKYSNTSKMVVLIDEEKIERMAEDEKFRKQYEGIISQGASGLNQLKSKLANMGLNVKSCGMNVYDNGATSFFATMDQSFKSQNKTAQERLARKKAAKKAEEKKAAKKAEEKKRQEKLEEGRTERKEIREEFYESDGEGEVTFTADTIEDLISQIENADYLVRRDIRSSFERQVGQKFDSAI
ncbi:MAG: hypothetical protein K2P42_00840 [Lachnospiraceae bacterium]|nr:hypothetical protein [Lachnospiraceae bacterium]MDE7000320.1 hypothetical protein [Lachnospiraceae bacterium]